MKKRMIFALLLAATISVVCAAQDATPGPSPEASPKPKPAMNKRQIERQLIKYENEMWEAWKDKDSKVMKARLVPEAILIGDSGIVGKDEVVKEIGANTCEVKSFKLSDFKLVVLSGTYVLAYKGAEEGTCGGTALPAVVWGATSWVRRNGKWYAAIHQETPMK